MKLEELQQWIEQHDLTNLNGLIALSNTRPELKSAMLRASALTGLAIAPLIDPARQAHAALSEATRGVADLRSDQGLFVALAEMRFIPHRTAGDVPGFETTTFANKETLWALLNRFVDDPMARRRLSGPMRQSVLEHDTYDTLVERILRAFADDQEQA